MTTKYRIKVKGEDGAITVDADQYTYTTAAGDAVTVSSESALVLRFQKEGELMLEIPYQNVKYFTTNE